MRLAPARLAAAASALVLSGCTKTYQLSVDPDPPLAGADYVAIWFAVAAVTVVLAMHAVRVVALTRRPLRLAAGGLIAIWVVGILLGVAVGVAMEVRTGMILGGGDCRSVPVEARPESILDLSCTTSLEGIGYAFALIYLGVATILTLFALPVLLDRRWWSAAIPGLVIGSVSAWVVLSSARWFDNNADDTVLLVWAGSGLVVGGMLLAEAALTALHRPSRRQNEPVVPVTRPAGKWRTSGPLR